MESRSVLLSMWFCFQQCVLTINHRKILGIWIDLPLVNLILNIEIHGCQRWRTVKEHASYSLQTLNPNDKCWTMVIHRYDGSRQVRLHIAVKVGFRYRNCLERSWLPFALQPAAAQNYYRKDTEFEYVSCRPLGSSTPVMRYSRWSTFTRSSLMNIHSQPGDEAPLPFTWSPTKIPVQ